MSRCFFLIQRVFYFFNFTLPVTVKSYLLNALTKKQKKEADAFAQHPR